MTIPEIPSATLKAAMDAAWPGLPAGMTLEEAERRTRKAIAAAFPQLLDDVCDRILDFGRDAGDHQTANAYARVARGN
jgi:hypothetical protein